MTMSAGRCAFRPFRARGTFARMTRDFRVLGLAAALVGLLVVANACFLFNHGKKDEESTVRSIYSIASPLLLLVAFGLSGFLIIRWMSGESCYPPAGKMRRRWKKCSPPMAAAGGPPQTARTSWLCRGASTRRRD